MKPYQTIIVYAILMISWFSIGYMAKTISDENQQSSTSNIESKLEFNRIIKIDNHCRSNDGLIIPICVNIIYKGPADMEASIYNTARQVIYCTISTYSAKEAVSDSTDLGTVISKRLNESFPNYVICIQVYWDNRDGFIKQYNL